MNPKLQVPVFINESWTDGIFPWKKNNALPFVRVIFQKTRHTVNLDMGDNVDSFHRILTASGVGHIISLAREFSRNVTGCRVFLTAADIINIPVKESGYVAERIAQIAAVEYQLVSYQELIVANSKMRQSRKDLHCLGYIMSSKKTRFENNKYHDSIWDNDETRRNEKNDPANWWKNEH
jgi:hypothetical protein